MCNIAGCLDCGLSRLIVERYCEVMVVHNIIVSICLQYEANRNAPNKALIELKPNIYKLMKCNVIDLKNVLQIYALSHLFLTAPPIGCSLTKRIHGRK